MKIYINESQVKTLLDNLITEQQVFRYPGDVNWSYSLQKGRWYAQKAGWPQNKWVKISDDPRYAESVKRLDKQFPNARPEVQVGGIPTRNTGPAYNETPDFNVELPTPGYKDPNRFINKR